jgi:hypothetical protein
MGHFLSFGLSLYIRYRSAAHVLSSTYDVGRQRDDDGYSYNVIHNF